MKPTVEVESDGAGAWRVVVGPFRDPGVARHASDLFRAVEADELRNYARIPSHVLSKVVEAMDHLTKGPGSFVLRGDGDEHVVDVELSKTSRARDPRPRPKRKAS